MRVLLDTCTFLWLALEPGRLSKKAVETLNDDAHSLFLSYVSSWEIALKFTAGKLLLPLLPHEWIPSRRAFFKIEAVGISEAMIFRTCHLSPSHPDPFDRLLAAQAIENGYTILSPDTKLDLLGAVRVW